MILTNVISTTIEKAEVIELYKTLLENQSSNFSTLINFFLAISGILITISLAYNYIIAKNQIKNEVKKEVENIEENIKVKYDIYLKEEIERIEKSFKNKLLNNEATALSSVAMHCMKNSDYSGCITFSFYALERFIDLGTDIVIRQSVDSIYNILTNPAFVPEIDADKLDYNEIVRVVNKIPDLLTIEKENITKELNLFKSRVMI